MRRVRSRKVTYAMGPALEAARDSTTSASVPGLRQPQGWATCHGGRDMSVTEAWAPGS